MKHSLIDDFCEVIRKRLNRGEGAFESLKIDYHQPFVDRLFFYHQEYRIHLHRIHPLVDKDVSVNMPFAESLLGAIEWRDTSWGQSDPLWHPHDAPAVFKIMAGEYEHSVGDGNGPFVSTIHGPGTTYVMDNPAAFHSVRPTQMAHTVMITGKPYPKDKRIKVSTVENVRGQLRPLDKEDKHRLWLEFYYIFNAKKTQEVEGKF